jgi:predicted DNA-binding transcriptional regulator YafY
MYHPSTRLLTILELLQNHAELSGQALARRLEVETRTVRRYIMMLQDMGMPIEATRGPGGGYRLRSGFKLPPLMFTEEEATALVLGLFGTAWLELELPAVAVEGALAKVSRVLPARARERIHAMSTHLHLGTPGQFARPAAALLLNLTEAIHHQQRVDLAYRSYESTITQRKVEPYGITGWRGHWYMVGYCHLRQDYRTFRLDRIQQAEVLAETFERDAEFDYRAYLRDQHSTSAPSWPVVVEFQAPLYLLQEKIPAAYGTLTATPGGVRFECDYEDLAGLARYLVGLNVPFVIEQPTELREALRHLAEQIMGIAANQSPPAG